VRASGWVPAGGLLLLALAVTPASGAGSAGVRHASPAAEKLRVAGGLYHGLAVTSGGAVFAWGWNIVGQLGDGSTDGSDVPVRVRLPGGAKVSAVAAGFAHSVALTLSGEVLAWGKNYNGNLGNGSTTDSGVPVKVNLPAGTKVTAVAAGGYFSLALTSTGAVLAWGYGSDGELGDGGARGSDVPVKVKLPAGTKVTAIAAGGSLEGVGTTAAGPGHGLAVTSTGAVLAWGDNADGELGDGGTKDSAVPVKVKLPAKATAVAAGELHSLALTSTGAVLAWGGDNFGQLGDGSYQGSDVPVRVKLP
jgi:alpha-tubulin suppressor-like RCC1 family protein